MGKKQTRRRIHLFNKVWEYYISRGGNILIWGPDGEKHTTDMSKVSGWNWNEIERGTWKRYFSITPAQIKHYIEYNLI